MGRDWDKARQRDHRHYDGGIPLKKPDLFMLAPYDPKGKAKFLKRDAEKKAAAFMAYLGKKAKNAQK